MMGCERAYFFEELGVEHSWLGGVHRAQQVAIERAPLRGRHRIAKQPRRHCPFLRVRKCLPGRVQQKCLLGYLFRPPPTTCGRQTYSKEALGPMEGVHGMAQGWRDGMAGQTHR